MTLSDCCPAPAPASGSGHRARFPDAVRSNGTIGFQCAVVLGTLRASRHDPAAQPAMGRAGGRLVDVANLSGRVSGPMSPLVHRRWHGRLHLPRIQTSRHSVIFSAEHLRVTRAIPQEGPAHRLAVAHRARNRTERIFSRHFRRPVAGPGLSDLCVRRSGNRNCFACFVIRSRPAGGSIRAWPGSISPRCCRSD